MPTVTLASIDADVLHRIEENSALYPAQERFDAINESVRVVNLWTGFSQARLPIGQTIANRQFYDVPAPFVIPLSLYVNFREIRAEQLSSMSTHTADFLKRTSATDGAARMWAKIGLRKFLLWPADAQGGGYMEMAGITEPPLLVNNTDLLTLPDGYLDLVVEMSFITLVLKESGQVFSDAVKTSWPRVQAGLKALSRWTGDKNQRLDATLTAAR